MNRLSARVRLATQHRFCPVLVFKQARSQSEQQCSPSNSPDLVDVEALRGTAQERCATKGPAQIRQGGAL